MAAFVTGEGNWLPLAMAMAAVVCGIGWGRLHSRTERRPLITFVMNLFLGLTIAIMGVGHLLAVGVRLQQGTLQGSPPILFAIGIAVIVPAVLIVAHARRLAAGGDHPAWTAALNAWLAGTLVALGLVNTPLAVPALLNIGYRYHTRRRVGVALVIAAIAMHAALLIGGLMFMASGQTFEEFSRTR